MTELITKIKYLPDGVREIVYKYMPRNDTAAIIEDAINKNKLNLNYVRARLFPREGSKALPREWTLASSPGDLTRSNEIIVWHLKELRPSRLLCDTYGDGLIKRKNISVGEKVRLQAIKKGIMSIIKDSRYNIKLVRNY